MNRRIPFFAGMRALILGALGAVSLNSAHTPPGKHSYGRVRFRRGYRRSPNQHSGLNLYGVRLVDYQHQPEVVRRLQRSLGSQARHRLAIDSPANNPAMDVRSQAERRLLQP